MSSDADSGASRDSPVLLLPITLRALTAVLLHRLLIACLPKRMQLTLPPAQEVGVTLRGFKRLCLNVLLLPFGCTLNVECALPSD